MLKNKNILIAITGSIAIYKTCDLIRMFAKAGANIRIVMSESAKKFVTPLTFEVLSGSKVLDEITENWSNDYNHIAIGKWADIFIIAPATANTINKLSNGIADNLLTQIALAYPRIKILAPAANTNMIENPLTQASLKMLKLCNYEIVSPVSKELACKDIGNGAMADVADIFDVVVREISKDDFWVNRKVVITAGGTIEKIDDVRYISNFSSGKMGVAIANALHLLGAEVCLIKTKNVTQSVSKAIHTITVESSKEMNGFVIDSIRVAKKGVMTKATLMNASNVELIRKKPFFFSVAAVSDFVPKFPQNGKIKKELMGENWQLELTKNIDILASIDKSEIYSVGFKAEFDTNEAQNNAKKMLSQKKLDFVCLNILGDENHFGSDQNEIQVFSKNETFTINKMDKNSLAFEIANYLKKQAND